MNAKAGHGCAAVPRCHSAKRATARTDLSITVLVVDDDPDDRLWAGELLEQIGIVGAVRSVSSGDDLLAYLRRSGPFAEAADWRRPDLVLLDLYMPGSDGLDVLRQLRAATDLPRIPVVILTGSESSGDVEQAYALGARSYLVKPLTLERMIVSLDA